MIVASTVLAGVYAVVGLVLASIVGVWGAVIGLPIIIGVQYLVIVQLPLWRGEAAEITRDKHPELHNRADRLADEMEIAKPKLFIDDMPGMNASALGRRNSGKVFISKEAIMRLTTDELETVLAHEFAHLKNRDSILMGFGASIVAVISATIFLVFLIASTQSKRPWLIRVVVHSFPTRRSSDDRKSVV